MTTDVDVAVVGLGGIGSAAAYWLARRPGLRVLGLERFELGHLNGASEDVSRIIRRSYHRRDYVRLTARAYEAWAAVEAESGARIVTRTGGLDVGPIETADGAEIDIEHVRRRDGGRGRPVRAPRRSARSSGAGRPGGWARSTSGCTRPRPGSPIRRRATRPTAGWRPSTGRRSGTARPVVSIEDAGDGEITLELEDGELVRAGHVVLAADAWTNELLAPLGLELPLTITQEQVAWFAPRDDPALFSKERFPVWIWMDEPSFYGFPTHRHPGPKVGQDVGGREVTPATRTFETDPEALARATAFLDRYLPGMAGDPFLVKTCLYTMTPDRDFIVDALPGHPQVLLLQGAAHAYKFASVLGQIAAELVVDGATPSAPELEAFRADRPALREGRPARFVV